MGVLWTLQSSKPGLSFYSALPMAYGTSYYAISLSINIVLSLLIVTRLFQYKRTVARTMTPEHAQQYLSLATVLVESAALYSLFALLFLITYATSNPANKIFLGAASATQVRHIPRSQDQRGLTFWLPCLPANFHVHDHLQARRRQGVEEHHSRHHCAHDDAIRGPRHYSKVGPRHRYRGLGHRVRVGFGATSYCVDDDCNTSVDIKRARVGKQDREAGNFDGLRPSQDAVTRRFGRRLRLKIALHSVCIIIIMWFVLVCASHLHWLY